MIDTIVIPLLKIFVVLFAIVLPAVTYMRRRSTITGTATVRGTVHTSRRRR